MSATVSTFGHRGTTSSVKTEIVRELVNATDGAGLHFDGSAGYIDIASPPDLGTAFSFEFVVKADSWGGAGDYLVDFHSSGTRFIFGSYSSISNNLGVYTPPSVDTAIFSDFGVKILDDLKVHHLVLTIDGTTAKLYDNSNLVGSTLTLTGSNQIDAATTLNIGKDTQATTRNLDGTIYRCRFYNKALSSAEVQTAYERADVNFADQYGSQTELVINGDFASATGWSVQSVAIGSNVSTWTDDGSTLQFVRRADWTIEKGKKYRLQFTVSSFSGAGSIGLFDYARANRIADNISVSGNGTVTAEFTAQNSSSSGALLGTADAANNIAAVIDDLSCVQIGAVVDMDLAFASPTQSLTVQDRAGAADGTCSASGVTQVQPVVQLNATAARIGTSAATPADGQLIIGAGGSGGTASAHADELLIDSNGNSGITIASGASDYGGINFSDSGNNSAGIVRYDHSDNSLKLYTQTTQRLTLDASGNVTVDGGDLKIKSPAGSVQDAELLFNSTNASAVYGATYAIDSKIISTANQTDNAYGSKLKFYTSDNSDNVTERLAIDSSGNITTTSDGIALKLDGTSNTTRGIFIRNTGGSAHGYLHTDGNLKIIAEDAGKSISFYTANDGSGTARLSIASTGETIITRDGDEPCLELSTNNAGCKLNFSRSGDPTAYIRMYEDGAVGTGSLRFATGSSATPVERLTISSTGAVGLSVAPESWQSTRTALQIGGNGSLNATSAAGAGGHLDVAQNAYINSSGSWSYISTDEASLYNQVAGKHNFKVAASGTADAAISFTTALEIANTGLATFSNGITVNGAVGSFANGIYFSSQTGAASPASTTTSVLNHYEEGTFTLTDASGAGLSLVNGAGKYTRIGDRVFITVAFSMPTITNGSHMVVSGLPFPVEDSNDSRGLVLTYSNKADVKMALAVKNTDDINFFTSTGSNSTCTNGSAGDFYINGHYKV